MKSVPVTARQQQHGMTFIELIISIVVISVAVVGILLVMRHVAGRSADPMLEHQAVAIAEAYLEEILANPVNDPTDAETGSAEAGEVRATFDDVRDYSALPDSVVRNQDGTAIAALNSYSVTVAVANADLGPAGAGRIPAASGQAVAVTVTVTHATGPAITVSGYRTEF